LASEEAIILERPRKGKDDEWQLAKVLSFDKNTGGHRVRFANVWGTELSDAIVNVTHNFAGDDIHKHSFIDGREAILVLASREYFILGRIADEGLAVENVNMEVEPTIDCGSDAIIRLHEAVGSSVECNLDGSSWRPFTLIAVSEDSGCAIVSETGEVLVGVRLDCIRVKEPDQAARSGEFRLPGWARDDRGDFNRAYPLFASRAARLESGRHRNDINYKSHSVGVLKRSWSALSLAESMRPVDLKISEETGVMISHSAFSHMIRVNSIIGGRKITFVFDRTFVETPPELSVKLSAHNNHAGFDFNGMGETALISALRQLQEYQGKGDWIMKGRSCRLYYSIFRSKSPQLKHAPISQISDAVLSGSGLNKFLAGLTNRNGVHMRYRTPISRSLTNEEDESNADLFCPGLDETSVQCMEIIQLLSEFKQESSIPLSDSTVTSLFSNLSLSGKLVDQLDKALPVVGNSLPKWSMLAPSFAPHVFSYSSRRELLERVAFGASRSALKLQEAKVNVGRLRNRMTALRARAVELVGEAFSGGAEDPTALQLQADELYGMEEALAARVRAAFKAVKWHEHSLDVAKIVVRREKLLSDATIAMQKYANDPTLFRRRLEVRFDGESGFDAASGNEAGVTRGFYADVAEALLLSDTAAGYSGYSACPPSTPTSVYSLEMKLVKDDEWLIRLPLWIPDIDASNHVIIPTPRAGKCSGLGVYPRPMSAYDPTFPQVLLCFRFIGRLFAVAFRDGFMFPLPLSSSFLKIVRELSRPDAIAEDKSSSFSTILSSADLPRPGFIGGEVYAAEMFVCNALDNIDATDPPLSRLERDAKYKEIATDCRFARVALGKNYDCSFDEYFLERTFVDPLDFLLGDDAMPLCQNGAHKSVTIYNIREYVSLAKRYILHDGIFAQALAFREGIEDLFPVEYLRIFTPEELQRDVCGGGDNVENWDEGAIRKLFKLDGGKGAAEALVAVAAIGGEGGNTLSRRFGPSSPTIAHLVKGLLEASVQQRRQFLSFVTSVPIVTPGSIEVVPMVSPSGEFLPMHDPSCLPRANTCARRLYLPKFEDYNSFTEVIWAVVREESKFKGFYEWRGS
jgi:hypothetical protein